MLSEPVDLILHQGDERRDDDREVVAQQGRKLIAERLAGARRHDHQHVAPGERRIASRMLAAAELPEAEVLA